MYRGLFVYIIKRTLHGGLKIWILFSRGKNNIYSLAALVRKILFRHSIIKFISSRHRVISSIYKTVSLKMQVFVVFTYLSIYIYSWLNFQVIPIVSFPRALGWRVNYCSGLSNDLVPRVLKLDFLRRARTRLIEYS